MARRAAVVLKAMKSDSCGRLAGPATPAGGGVGSSGDHVYRHPAWPGQRQGLAGLLAGYPVTSSARFARELLR